MKTLRMFTAISMATVMCLIFSACSDSDNNKDKPNPGDQIQKVEVPSSDAANPIIAGQMVVIHGEGFTQDGELWIQPSVVTKTEVTGVKAEIVSVSENGIAFMIPQISGQCDVLLEQGGKSQKLGSVYLVKKDLSSLAEHLYVIGGQKNDFPAIHECNLSSNSIQKVEDLHEGRVVKSALSSDNGSGIVYYFQQLSPNSDATSLCSYNLKTNQEKVLCTDWLTKFNKSANGQAIGMIDGSLCGVEASLKKGFEVICFGQNGTSTLIKRFSPTQLIEGKEVIAFYCEDDNLLFNYDSSTKSILLTGFIQFKGEKDTSECLLSLNMRTGEIKMIRDEQSNVWFQTLQAGSQMLLLEITKRIDKTTIKTLNPATLESKDSFLVEQYLFHPVYGKQSNSIYWWSQSNGSSSDGIMKYSLDTHTVGETTVSLPYIEALFSIKY